MGRAFEFEWDEAKRRTNLERHGVDFAAVEAFDWSTVKTSNQTVGGERRHQSFGLIDRRLYVLVWTRRNGRVRVISLRKANIREFRKYNEV